MLFVKTDILTDSIVFAPIMLKAESQFENVELTIDTAQVPVKNKPVPTKDKLSMDTFKILILSGVRNTSIR